MSILLLLIGCTAQEKPINESESSSNDSPIVKEYKAIIQSDPDHDKLKNLPSDIVEHYAKAYCKLKQENISDLEINQYLDEQAERIADTYSSNSSDKITTKYVLRKAQTYSMQLGKKYYCS